MRKNLIKANELIHNIQNFSNVPKKLRENCAQLEDLCEYIEKDKKYHYMLFLTEVYASKLREFRLAQKICRQVIQDPRPAVQLQGTLRLSFICALQHKYNHAIKSLQQADSLSDKKQQLQAIFIDYCIKLFTYSKQNNLLNGLKCENEQKYEQAMNFYNAQFESQVIAGQIQCQYFAAKAILQLTSIFPNRNFAGVDPKKCNEYLRELYQQKQQRDDLSLIEKLDQNYKAQKGYLIKIVELLKKKQISIKTVRSSTKGVPNNKFHSQLMMKKILAILKLEKVLKTQSDLNVNIKKQFTKCLQDLKSNRVQNYNLLNQFVMQENKVINRINDLIKIKGKQNGFNVLKTLVSQRRKQVRNRFKNHPSMQQSPTRKSPLFSQHPSLKSLPSNQRDTRDQKSFKDSNSKMKLQFGFSINSAKQNEEYMSEYFEGSYMNKINENSNGHDLRYFYLRQDEIQKGKFNLYYCSKKQKKSLQDRFYDLRKFSRVEKGKTTKAFQRQQCAKFSQQKCFSIIYQDGKSRNFYVPEQKDYNNWIALLKDLQNYKENIFKKSQPYYSRSLSQKLSSY